MTKSKDKTLKKVMGAPSSDEGEKKKSKKKKVKAAKEKEEDIRLYSREDLDLSREILPIVHYVRDKRGMIQQLFSIVNGARLQAMLPPILKPIPNEELQNLCLQELSRLSVKKVQAILVGHELGPGLSSESEQGDSDQEESPEPSPSKKKKKAHTSERDSRSSRKSDRNSEKPEPEEAAVSKDKSTNTLLELLELEMRARAIKSLLGQDGEILEGEPPAEKANPSEGGSEVEETVQEEQEVSPVRELESGEESQSEAEVTELKSGDLEKGVVTWISKEKPRKEKKKKKRKEKVVKDKAKRQYRKREEPLSTPTLTSEDELVSEQELPEVKKRMNERKNSEDGEVATDEEAENEKKHKVQDKNTELVSEESQPVEESIDYDFAIGSPLPEEDDPETVTGPPTKLPSSARSDRSHQEEGLSVTVQRREKVVSKSEAESSSASDYSDNEKDQEPVKARPKEHKNRMEGCVRKHVSPATEKSAAAKRKSAGADDSVSGLTEQDSSKPTEKRAKTTSLYNDTAADGGISVVGAGGRNKSLAIGKRSSAAWVDNSERETGDRIEYKSDAESSVTEDSSTSSSGESTDIESSPKKNKIMLSVKPKKKCIVNSAEADEGSSSEGESPTSSDSQIREMEGSDGRKNMEKQEAKDASGIRAESVGAQRGMKVFGSSVDSRDKLEETRELKPSAGGKEDTETSRKSQSEEEAELNDGIHEVGIYLRQTGKDSVDLEQKKTSENVERRKRTNKVERTAEEFNVAEEGSPGLDPDATQSDLEDVSGLCSEERAKRSIDKSNKPAKVKSKQKGEAAGSLTEDSGESNQELTESVNEDEKVKSLASDVLPETNQADMVEATALEQDKKEIDSESEAPVGDDGFWKGDYQEFDSGDERKEDEILNDFNFEANIMPTEIEYTAERALTTFTFQSKKHEAKNKAKKTSKHFDDFFEQVESETNSVGPTPIMLSEKKAQPDDVLSICKESMNLPEKYSNPGEKAEVADLSPEGSNSSVGGRAAEEAPDIPTEATTLKPEAPHEIGESWGTRYITSEKVQKIKETSKIFSKVRSKIKEKGQKEVKPIEEKASKESAKEIVDVVGSLVEYENLAGKAVGVRPPLPEDIEEDEEESALWGDILG